jgi:hypothetical protein
MGSLKRIDITFFDGGLNISPWGLEVLQDEQFEFALTFSADIQRGGIYFKDSTNRFFGGTDSQKLVNPGSLPNDPVVVEAVAPNFNLPDDDDKVVCAYGVYGIRKVDGARVEIDPEIVVRKI